MLIAVCAGYTVDLTPLEAFRTLDAELELSVHTDTPTEVVSTLAPLPTYLGTGSPLRDRWRRRGKRHFGPRGESRSAFEQRVRQIALDAAQIQLQPIFPHGLP